MTKQRTSLVDMSRIAAKAKAEVPAVRSEEPAAYETAADKPDMTTTAVHLPKATLALLRRVAVERANRHGGRPSVSAVLVALVEGQRAALEAELGRSD